MSKPLLQLASDWLNQPDDYQIGLTYFLQLSPNLNLKRYFSGRTDLSGLVYELKKLVPAGSSSDDSRLESDNNLDSSSDESPSSSTILPETLTDEQIASELELLRDEWLPFYKDAANDQAELKKIYALIEQGGDKAALTEQARIVASALIDKMKGCKTVWEKQAFIEANKALPTPAETVSNEVTDFSESLKSLTDIELIKARGNARSNVSRFKNKPEQLANWNTKLAAIDLELETRKNGSV